MLWLLICSVISGGYSLKFAPASRLSHIRGLGQVCERATTMRASRFQLTWPSSKPNWMLKLRYCQVRPSSSENPLRSEEKIRSFPPSGLTYRLVGDSLNPQLATS